MAQEKNIDKAILDIRDQDPVIKRLAARAIFRLSENPEEIFKSIIAGADSSTIVAICEVLLKEHSDFSSIFSEVTDNPDPRVRRMAIRYLFRKSRFRVEDGVRWLNDRDPYVRRRVLRYLSWVNDRSAIEPIAHVAIMDEDASVRKEALKVLSVHGHKEDAGLIIKALEDKDTEVRIQAIKTLKDMTGEDFGDPIGVSDDDLEWIVAKWQGWWDFVKEEHK